MMENHKILPIKDINKEIFSILGMDITVFEFIDYAEKRIIIMKFLHIQFLVLIVKWFC